MGISIGRRIAIAVILMAAAGCAATGGRMATGSPAAAPDAFSLELNYWGRPSASWRLGSNGEGEYRATEPAPSRNFEEYDIVTRRFSAGEDGFQRVRTIMDQVARLAPADLPCGTRIFDLPYGRVNWHRGDTASSLDFNFGCGSPRAQQVMGLLGEATTLVQGWSSNQPVANVRQVRQPAAQQ